MAIFADGYDRQTSLRYMAEEAERCGVTFLGWCMMTNHVHLITVPEQEDSLARALSTPIGAAHAGRISEPGYAATCLRGGSIPCVLDETHLLAAGQSVERNPVKEFNAPPSNSL